MTDEFYTPKPTDPIVKKIQFKTCEKTCLITTVNGEEFVDAVKISKGMWANEKTWDVWGRGQRPDACAIGKLGEMGFAKIFALGVDAVYRRGGDSQDFEMDDHTINIKTQATDYGKDVGWIRSETGRGKDVPLDADVYIFIYLEGYNEHEVVTEKSSVKVVIVGWCKKTDIAEWGLKKLPALKGDHKNYYVPFSLMRPIMDIYNYWQKIKPAKHDNPLLTNFTSVSNEYIKFLYDKIDCKRCSIGDCYKCVVSSEGNAKDPTFMFIGEAPGKSELGEGKPFIGRAGQYMRSCLRKHPEAFTKENTIITNVLPCRPPDNKFPISPKKEYWFDKKDNKVNATTLVRFCMARHLEKEIAILKPKVLVLLGSHALFYVMGEKGITDHRGRWTYLDRYNAWAFATYHPSYVIRQGNTETSYIAKEFESDIKTISLAKSTVLSKVISAEKRLTEVSLQLASEYNLIDH